VGRNTTKGSSLVRELQQLNPSATVFFIQADLTILRNADQVLKIVSEKEKKVNLLFLSQGFLSLKGRQGKYINHRGYQTATTNAPDRDL
jgi:short-subunit dehydrogenase